MSSKLAITQPGRAIFGYAQFCPDIALNAVRQTIKSAERQSRGTQAHTASLVSWLSRTWRRIWEERSCLLACASASRLRLTTTRHRKGFSDSVTVALKGTVVGRSCFGGGRWGATKGYSSHSADRIPLTSATKETCRRRSLHHASSPRAALDN